MPEYRTAWYCPNHQIRAGSLEGAIDWNCNGRRDAAVSVDLNNDDQRTILTPHDDWHSLVYSDGRIGATSPNLPVLPTRTAWEESAQEELVRLADAILIAPPPPVGEAGARDLPNRGPTSGGVQPVLDNVRPRLLLKLSPDRFYVRQPRAKRRVRLGGEAVFTLSEPTTVRFVATRLVLGRQVGRACVPQSARNRAKPGCTRHVRVGHFVVPGRLGSNRARLPFAMARRWMRGAYNLDGVATDAAGNPSARQRVRFQVLG